MGSAERWLVEGDGCWCIGKWMKDACWPRGKSAACSRPGEEELGGMQKGEIVLLDGLGM